MKRRLSTRTHALVTGTVVLALLQIAGVFYAPGATAAGITVQEQGARFDVTPTEGAERLVLKHVLEDSPDNRYPWETDNFSAEGYCVDVYGRFTGVAGFAAGAHPSGHTWMVDKACPDSYYAGKWRVYMTSGAFAGKTMLAWDAEVPVTKPPPQQRVTVAMEGARFKVLPVAGSRRLKGTHVLGDSSDNSYPWETDNFAADGRCVSPSGDYVSVGSFGAGSHPNGQTWEFDHTCPDGMTAAKWRVYMTGGTRAGETVLEWDASALGVSAEQTWGQGVHAENPSATLSDPVNTATGAFVTSVTDLELGGIGVPFRFARSYTSADRTNGALGQGWTHTYSASLGIQASGDVVLRGEDGQHVLFQKQTDGSFIAAPGGRSRLTATPEGYELTRSDGTTYSFNPAGRLSAMRDRNGHGVTLAYGADGNLSVATDAAGRATTFSYNDSAKMTRVTLPDGRFVAYGYASGLLISVTDVRDGTTTYSYDAYGRLAEIIGQNGNRVVKNVYGAGGRVVEQIDSGGNSSTFSWDGESQTATMTDARGNAWTDIYQGNVLVKRMDPLGNVTEYQWDPATMTGLAVIDPRGHKTSMTYDPRGNLLTRTAPAPLSYREEFTYDSDSNLTAITDGRGNKTTFAYDAAGNLVLVTNPDGSTTEYVRDPETGLINRMTDSRGKATSYGYDSSKNLVTVTSPRGHATTITYDGSGRVTSIIDPRGNETGANPDDFRTTFSYNAANQLKDQSDPLGNTTAWSYDAAGNLVDVTDAKGRVTQYRYNAANLLVAVTAPDSSQTSYSYDPAGNVVTRTDAKAHTTTYAYDAANRLTSVTSPIGQVWSYTHDGSGNVSAAVDPTGNATADAGDGTTSYSYDAVNRPTSVDFSDQTPDVAFSYDPNSNLVEMTDGLGVETRTFDSMERLTSVSRGPDTFAYAYDLAGNVTRRTYPGGTTTDYTYDDDGRLSSASSSEGSTTYAYDSAGRVVRTTLPTLNGHVETRGYDRAGRLIKVENARAVAPLSSFTYTLDAVGNPTKVQTLDETITYSYDALDRLKETCFDRGCDDPLEPSFIRYDYDSVGNRTAEVRPSGTTTYTYNNADQLIEANSASGVVSYEHDTNGNLTKAGSSNYAYNVANQLIAVANGSMATTYTYDGQGMRKGMAEGSPVTNEIEFLWDTNHRLPQLAVERDGAGRALRGYMYGLDLLTMRSAGATSYYHYDGIGTVVDVTSASGLPQWSYEYEPFGASRSSLKVDPLAPDNPMRFTGEYRDTTGLYHLRARQYDSSLGRFLSVDPFPAPVLKPYLCAYSYVGNQPTMFVDPSGLVAEGVRSCRDWGSFVAGGANVLYGGYKYATGIGTFVGATVVAKIPFIGQVVGPKAVAYGTYQTVSGAARLGRGAAQLSLGPWEGVAGCTTGDQLQRFGRGVTPDFTGDIWDWLAGAP